MFFEGVNVVKEYNLLLFYIEWKRNELFITTIIIYLTLYKTLPYLFIFFITYNLVTIWLVLVAMMNIVVHENCDNPIYWRKNMNYSKKNRKQDDADKCAILQTFKKIQKLFRIIFLLDIDITLIAIVFR